MADELDQSQLQFFIVRGAGHKPQHREGCMHNESTGDLFDRVLQSRATNHEVNEGAAK